MCWHPKHVYLENLAWVLIPKANKLGAQNLFSTFTKKQSVKKSKQTVICCFYCMKKGHSVRFCRIKKFSVPNGILKWVPKEPNDSWKYINTYGSKFTRGPDLAT